MSTVINIDDTRNYDDAGIPIPMSGVQRPCDHCGKTHDVICVLSNGMQVGVTCARKLANNAKRINAATYITIRQIKEAYAVVPSQIEELAGAAEIVDGKLTSNYLKMKDDYFIALQQKGYGWYLVGQQYKLKESQIIEKFLK